MEQFPKTPKPRLFEFVKHYYILKFRRKNYNLNIKLKMKYTSILVIAALFAASTSEPVNAVLLAKKKKEDEMKFDSCLQGSGNVCLAVFFRNLGERLLTELQIAQLIRACFGLRGFRMLCGCSCPRSCRFCWLTPTPT